jgi:hypothetical protein
LTAEKSSPRIGLTNSRFPNEQLKLVNCSAAIFMQQSNPSPDVLAVIRDAVRKGMANQRLLKLQRRKSTCPLVHRAIWAKKFFRSAIPRDPLQGKGCASAQRRSRVVHDREV